MVDAARRMTELMLDVAGADPYPGMSWASEVGSDEPPLCGLAHGASGPAWALAEMAA